MKKTVIILILVLVGIAGAGAQPRLRTPEMYIGIHGGVNASTVIFDPAVTGMSPITQGCLLNPTAGMAFRYAGHKYCGLQVELNYRQRGWREKMEEGAYTRQLHYIEVPFLMHLYFGKKNGKFIFNLGPQIGGCVYDDGGKGMPEGSTAKQHEKIEKPFYWGAAAGIGGYYHGPKSGIWEMEVRGCYSMGSIYGNNATDYFRTFSNPVELSVNVAWYYPVGRKQVEGRR